MNIIKKSAAVIIFVSFFASHHIYSMNKAVAIGRVILGTTSQQSLSTEDLPAEIMFLINTATNGTLNEAGKAVNALARVNRDLNDLINNPEYNKALIEHFVKKFNTGSFDVCLALQTQAAKLYYVNNRTSWGDTMLMKEAFPQKGTVRDPRALSFEQILQVPGLIVDIKDEDGNTALIHLLAAINKYRNNAQQLALLKNRLILLLNKGADPEVQNLNGITPAQLAKDLKDEDVIKAIGQAITKKRLNR